MPLLWNIANILCQDQFTHFSADEEGLAKDSLDQTREAETSDVVSE